jgi:hypothetical protein
MADPRCRWEAPAEWSEWSEYLAAGLHATNRWRLPVLLVGILFARGRRTVTTWLRAAGVSDDYQDYYYFLAALGRKSGSVATRLLTLVLHTLPLPDRLLAVIDDSPTKRYGPQVEGADIHHNPTPGPADARFLYGHVWVTLAARLVAWFVKIAHDAGKTVWVVVDGGYTKRPFLKPVLACGATVIGRLRKDAALRDVPKQPRRRGRGRPRKYGRHKISLAKRAGQTRGWRTIECTLYNKQVTKTYKTFLATYRPAGGVIRVVLVKEPHGAYAFFSTDPGASVVDILQAFADRSTIEQDFHDVKEVWGAGQQQVRNIWTNLAVYNLNLWMHTLVELWGWHREHGQLVDRDDSPWDDAERRPSHADRRKALREQLLRNQLRAIAAAWRLPKKFIQLTENLVALAA